MSNGQLPNLESALRLTGLHNAGHSSRHDLLPPAPFMLSKR
jgi:hypothetical protein